MSDNKVYMNSSYGSVKQHYGGKTFPFIDGSPPTGHDLSNPIDTMLNHGGKYSDSAADYMASTVALVLALQKQQTAAVNGDIPAKAASLIPLGNIVTVLATP